MCSQSLSLLYESYQNIYGAQHALTGRLIYPEALKHLRLYCLSLSKCLALWGGYFGATLDEQLFAGFDIMITSVPHLLNFLYPTMFQLDEHLVKVKEISILFFFKSELMQSFYIFMYFNFELEE